MKLLPPWSLAKRQEWAEAHPWLASVYSGLAASLLAVYIAVTKSIAFAVVLAVLIWLSVPLFALSIKRRWGQRPDASDHPRPTVRRLWSRASDRWLSRFMWFYALVAVASVFELIRDEDRGGAAFVLFLSIVAVATTATERRRRRAPP
jgi:hypothetical protein